jgi:trehalose 6-phosphate phosphatase
VTDPRSGPGERLAASRRRTSADATGPSARPPADLDPAGERQPTPGIPRVLESVDAVIFDLDGVVTDTMAVHAAAWKAMFDDFLRRRSDRTGDPFRPFDVDVDYRRYVDGRARVDGVRSFLASRGISLPEGGEADPPERETFHGLGNRKNAAFRERLAVEGARAYPSTVRLVEALRSRGVRSAVISASRNLDDVLDAAGLSTLFPVRVSGTDAARLRLPGKPDPAVFLEAAGRLEVEPSRAAIVEDALPGVEAGRRGGFTLVIGVDRTGHPDELRAAGADLVVSDLAELGEAETGGSDSSGHGVSHPLIEELPSALGAPGELARLVAGRRVAIFLDYDGTLTPIVADPEDARLDTAARHRIAMVARRLPVAIISGRDLADVQRMVGIDGLWYAGSHGFDIAGPRGQRHRHAPEAVGHLDLAEHDLRRAVGHVPGAWVERKAFAIAVHVRRTPDDRVAEVEAAVGRIAAGDPELRMTGGKRVFELRPAVAWDKGRAVLGLLAIEGLDREDLVPVYVGDDLTDEDAFVALRDRGIGIVVRGEGDRRTTAARLSLAEPGEVPELLERLAELAGAGS